MKPILKTAILGTILSNQYDKWDKSEPFRLDTPSRHEPVLVDRDGTEFEPPVLASQLPPETWYCGRGADVHYARMVKDDGVCPLCTAPLVQKAHRDG